MLTKLKDIKENILHINNFYKSKLNFQMMKASMRNTKTMEKSLLLKMIMT